MRPSRLTIAGAVSLLVAGCGGGGNDSAPVTPPPTSGAPTTPAKTDFNTFIVSLVTLQDAASEKQAPYTLEDQSFVFSDDGAAYTAVQPTS